MRTLLVALTLLTSWGCSNEPSMTEALKKADEAEQARKEAEARKKAAIEVEKKKDVLALPWTIDALKAQLKMGTVLTYDVSGTDIAGKEVTDEFIATVKGTDDRTARVNEYRVSNQADPVSKQVKTLDWSTLSPLFSIERAEATPLRTETVEVAAGSFETVVVDVKGYFGAHITAWMIVDKPGVYARVEDHGNANEEDDRTALVYELRSIATQ
jgi:hypothetical protein